MSSAEERIKILEMIQSGKITSEEGARLLQALHSGAKKATDRAGSDNARDARWLRVHVTDTRTGKPKVNVNLPMSLVNVGVKLGARFIPTESDFDFNGLMAAIQGGAKGKIFEYEDQTDGERVEIWVE